MKITQFSSDSLPRVESVVDFTPWPFADPVVEMKPTIRRIDSSGTVLVGSRTHSFNLSLSGFPLLVTFTDGTVATADRTGLAAYMDRTGQR